VCCRGGAWGGSPACAGVGVGLGPCRAARLARHAERVLRLPDALFATLSTLESPSDIGFVLDGPPVAVPDVALDTVVLDRLQDAGNVGSILRSAAALGVRQVLALKGTAALWSPKVLRAGMGRTSRCAWSRGCRTATCSPWG
jgi:TrmH family RNA methyltransferase